AEQVGLAGRPVVLKTSDVSGDEPQTLAQLQHTHIVPIYSVHEDARAGLRAVCMPYFGGASLSRVLEALYAECGRPTRGAELVAALGKVEPPKPASGKRPREGQAGAGGPEAEGQTPRGLLRSLPYLRAAAWVVA